MSDGSYEEYARLVIEQYDKRSEGSRNLLFDAVKDHPLKRVLDLGCGPGQELLNFLAKTDAVCVGVDIAESLGRMGLPFFAERGFRDRACLVRATGDKLPFADASFDVVLCRVALPYMDNRGTIAEVGRVLAPGGVFLLKTHAPRFYLDMFQTGIRGLDAKKLAYTGICVSKSLWHSATGNQLEWGLFAHKEVFQTRRFLEKEFAKCGLRIKGELPDSNPSAPSFRVVKH